MHTASSIGGKMHFAAYILGHSDAALAGVLFVTKYYQYKFISVITCHKIVMS